MEVTGSCFTFHSLKTNVQFETAEARVSLSFPWVLVIYRYSCSHNRCIWLCHVSVGRAPVTPTVTRRAPSWASVESSAQSNGCEQNTCLNECSHLDGKHSRCSWRQLLLHIYSFMYLQFSISVWSWGCCKRFLLDLDKAEVVKSTY